VTGQLRAPPAAVKRRPDPADEDGDVPEWARAMPNSSDSTTPTKSAPPPAAPAGWSMETPPPKTLVRCARHTDVDATQRCQLCGAHWCRMCVAIGDERGVVWRRCQCGGRCEAFAVEAPPASAQDFGAELLDALRYPFMGAARVQVIGGAVMFGLLSWLINVSFLLGPLIAGYLIAYVELVISSTVKGKDEPPGFPDFVTVGESMLAPLLRMLLLLLISFGPGLLAWNLLPGAGALLGGLLFIAGLAYFPMALLSVSVLDSIDGYDPRRVFGSIGVVPHQYALAATLFMVVFALILGSGFAPIDLPIVGTFVRGAVIFALATIAGRVLGLTYRRYGKQLGWV